MADVCKVDIATLIWNQECLFRGSFKKWER